MTAIDLEVGDWLIVEPGVARRVTGVEVHVRRGDGLGDGDVRIRMGAYEKVLRHNTSVEVIRSQRKEP